MVPISYFLLLAAILQVYCQSDVPIVKTVDGKIQGILKKESGVSYLQFQGVPYANPPIGNRRFAPPERMTKWSGIWVANTTYTCIQVDHRDPPQEGVTKGEEDCLFLDIYVPGEKINPEANLDVIIYVPGDAFMYGSSNEFGFPERVMSEKILFIAINYRVGIFGFLSLEDEVLPGNNGMRDQVMALQWIRENIKLFGGNPNSVTLTGFGSGGASVHFHMMSPLSKDLFQRALSVSGNVLDPWVMCEAAKQKAERVGSAVGCPYTGDSKAFLACLRLRTPHELIETTKLFREWLFYPFSPFALVVDRAAKKPFLPEQPYKLLKDKKVHVIPWVTVLAAAEGLYPFSQLLKNNYMDIMAKNLEKYLPLALHYNYTVSQDQMNEVTQKIIKEYLGNKPLDKNTFKDLVQMGSDRLYDVGMAKSVRLQAKATKAPVYFLYDNYTAENVMSMPEYLFGIKEKYGVCHGDNMLLAFGDPKKDSKNDATMRNTLVDITVNFAKTGKIEWKDWSPIDGSSKTNSYLYVGSPSDMEIRTDADFANEPFWDSLPIMENEKLVDSQARDNAYT